MAYNKVISRMEMELERLKYQLTDNLEWYSQSGEVSKHEHNAWGWLEATEYMLKELTRYKKESEEENG
jgi:hypothetical protein|tara:strand:- start:60 stop:263 length:204 start_codon:yes stop_codon:yes gene_type:complete